MSDEEVSSWQKASTIANYLEVAAVVISLGIIIFQLHQQTKLSRAANAQSLVNLITPLNLKVTEREMAELWVKGEAGIDQLSDKQEQLVQRERYEQLLASYMTFYENVYSQNEAGLLDPQVYSAWDKDLASFIEAQKLKQHWNEWKGSYRKDFSDHVDQIIRAQK
jgi:hypothetical protein